MNLSSLQLERAIFLKFYESTVIVFLRWLSLSFGALGALILLLSLVFELPNLLLAASLLLLAVGLGAGSFHLYVLYTKTHPLFLMNRLLITANPINLVDLSLADALLDWKKKRTWRSLFEAFSRNDELFIIFMRLGISTELISSIIPDTPNETELDGAFKELAKQKKVITALDLLQIIIPTSPFGEVLSQLSIDEKEFTNLIEFYRERQDREQALFERSLSTHPPRTGGFAKEWSVSYTTLLDHFSYEITPEISSRTTYSPIYGREGLIQEIITILNKSSAHHALLVGEPGVGKKEIFYHLAEKIIHYQSKTAIDGFSVRVLDSQRLLAASKDNQDLLTLLNRLMGDITRAGNVILFIDHIDSLLNPKGEIGTANIASALGDFLGLSKLRIIATTYPDSQIQLVRNNPILKDHFTNIEVAEPSGSELTKVFLSNLPIYENKYQVFFLYESILELLSLANRYIKDSASPKRELDLAEDVASQARSSNQKIIRAEIVRSVVERKAEVPLQVDETQRETLLNLEQKLHERIVGQDRAVTQVSDALLRARAGLSSETKPIGTFLFLGPTGVGKTETAKALAEIYFGSPQKLLRLDMTEYSDAQALTKLLGSDPVNQPGSLTVAIQQNPSSVVLLDELEKSSDQVKNVFLQLLDEGRLTTNYGKVLDLTNTIIIATSNAGSEFIKEQVSKQVNVAAFEKQLVDRLISTKIFLPEFLNRFDGVIVFAPLSKSEMKQIVSMQLQSLTQKVNEQKGVKLEIAQSVIDQLAEKGYDPVFGARALQRVIKNDLETVVARELISQQPKPGSTLTISSLF